MTERQSTVMFSFNHPCICRPLVAEASSSEGGELLGRQEDAIAEMDRIEGATPLVREEAGQQKDCGLV